MRDIQDDIRERLREIDWRQADEMADFAERFDHHRRVVADFDRRRTVLKAALAEEVQRIGGTAADAADAVSRTRLPLAEFITMKVRADGPLDKEALKAAASTAGYLDEATGRSFHLTLVNTVKHGKLIQLPDGSYSYPPATTESLFGMGQSEEGDRPLMQ